MVNARIGSQRNSLGVLWDFGTFSGLDDRELLARFVDRRDASSELAFEVLIRRHGPMVLGVSQALLGDRHAAEDAFQAVFLILARKARSIRNPEKLGPWLHGVTLKTARESRKRDQRRKKLAEQVAKLPTTPDPSPETALIQGENSQALHHEIARLPERYRTAVVLCDLEGLTQQEAASRLRCPTGTIAIRLKRAKERLRDRLTRRGLAPSASLIPLLARPQIAPRLLATTLKSSLASGLATASVVSLAEGVKMTMIFAKGKAATVGLVLTLGLATTWATSGGFAKAQKPEDPPLAVERAVARAITRPIRDCQEYNGVTDFLRKEAVRGRVSGRIEKVLTEAGRRVKANDVLFEFDPKPYEANLKLAQAEVLKAEAQERLAKAVEKRNAKLREKDPRYVSQEDFDKGVAELLLKTGELHDARQDETQAAVDLEATKVRARFDGTIVARDAVAKNFYEPKNPLAWIATTDPMVVEFNVDERTFLRLLRIYGSEKKALEDMEFDIKGSFEKGPPHPLKVESFPIQFDPATGTGKFRGTFANPPESNFRAGMLVRVRFWFGPPHEAVLVPEAAIVADGRQRFAYALNDKDVVERREVRLELYHDGQFEVKEGLKSGDRVVVEGLAELKSGMIIKPRVAAKPGR